MTLQKVRGGVLQGPCAFQEGGIAGWRAHEVKCASSVGPEGPSQGGGGKGKLFGVFNISLLPSDMAAPACVMAFVQKVEDRCGTSLLSGS